MPKKIHEKGNNNLFLNSNKNVQCLFLFLNMRGVRQYLIIPNTTKSEEVRSFKNLKTRKAIFDIGILGILFRKSYSTCFKNAIIFKK